MTPLTYDLILETQGILRSEDRRVTFDRDLELGEVISVHGRRWLVTRVAASLSLGLDRRAIARELVDESPL
jgi:hypothetical protein